MTYISLKISHIGPNDYVKLLAGTMDKENRFFGIGCSLILIRDWLFPKS